MPASTPLVHLSADALDRLELTGAEIVASIEHLIEGRTEGRVWNAPKATVTPPDGRYMMATLAAADDPPFLAVKSLVLNPRNPEHGLPQINSLVTLLDSETGIPVAVIDGNWVTEMRTPGLSAVAAKRLANPDAAVIGFIGCGVQARAHLRVFSELFPLQEIRAFGRGRANLDALCDTARALGLGAKASDAAREAVADADLVVTSVTLSPALTPFLDASWLKPGAFATVTDLAASWLPDTMNAFDCIVVDDLEQEAQMPQPLVAPELVAGDLGTLVSGGTAGRLSRRDRTAFVFRGLALGDLALAALAYDRAVDSRAPSAD